MYAIRSYYELRDKLIAAADGDEIYSLLVSYKSGFDKNAGDTGNE